MTTKTETLLGGKDCPVSLRDGTQATVFVRQIPVREMPKYLEVQDKEPEMIELVCVLADGHRCKPDFVDNLSPESHAELVAEIERINHDFFTAWGKRQKARGEKLKAEFTSASPTSPPSAPSNAA